MSDIDLIRSEVKDMSDREILLEILQGQRRQNGALAAIKGDMYGDELRGIRGVRPLVDAHELTLDRFKTRFQTLVGLAVFLGLGNLVALFTLVR